MSTKMLDKKKENKSLGLIVDFYKVYGGMIFFKLSLGDQKIDSRFSEVWDPLIKFKKWLEAISIGVKQCSFEYDPEGNAIVFDFNQVSWDRELFIVKEPWEDGEVFINGKVDRKQLVDAFYNGFLSFATSDIFISKEWEVEYLKDYLCDFLKVDESMLVNYLVTLKRKEFGEFLFTVDPAYTITYPTAKNKKEQIKFFVEEIINIKKNKKVERIETADDWDIPTDYDNWEDSEKKIFIAKCLKMRLSDFEGTKIKDFRSEIIEKYLKS
jgi:hypothetical protein